MWVRTVRLLAETILDTAAVQQLLFGLIDCASWQFDWRTCSAYDPMLDLLIDFFVDGKLFDFSDTLKSQSSQLKEENMRLQVGGGAGPGPGR
jgi:hypothetical protein